MNTMQVPIWEKYTLTIEEAAAYFRIGETKLRRIVCENRNADFLLWNVHKLSGAYSSDTQTDAIQFEYGLKIRAQCGIL